MTTTTTGTIDAGGARNQKPRKLRIACCSPPGHMNPTLNLAEGLAERSNINNVVATDDSFDGNEVCFVSLSYGAEKARSRCEASGIEVIPLQLGEGFDSDENIKALSIQQRKFFFLFIAEQCASLLEQALDEFRPDVVVADQFDVAALDYATSRNIPVVMNVPSNLALFRDFLRPVLNIERGRFWFSAGGLFLSYTPLTIFGLILWGNGMDLGRMAHKVRAHANCGNSVVLVDTFWGFEKPRYLLPPNIRLVGSTGKPLPKQPDFSKSHPELHTFLETARRHEKKIFVVTTGSTVRMEEWLVKVLWEAFEKVFREQNTTIVWSLKEDQQAFLTKEQLSHEAFFFSTWLPQPALLASDYVDGVLTHCGWNGTLECLGGGKPVVVLPFFADQMHNAGLLLESGCAVKITAKLPEFNVDQTGRSSYAGPHAGFRKRWSLPMVTVDAVATACAKLLGDPSYKKAAEKMRALSSGPGMGRDFACEVIEHAGKHGLEHLTETSIADHLTGHRPLVVTLVMCAVAVVGTMQALAWAGHGGGSTRTGEL